MLEKMDDFFTARVDGYDGSILSLRYSHDDRT